MKIGTLNIGHQTLRPRVVPEDLLDALVALDVDLLFLTEYVNTDAYAAALNRRWAHVLTSVEAPYRGSRCHNQLVALSRLPLGVRDGHQSVPTEAARTNFLSVEVAGLIVTGMRAPAYKPRDWYAYWDALARNGSESAIDHALVRPGVELRGEAAYHPAFFGRWGLEHCPLVIDVWRECEC